MRMRRTRKRKEMHDGVVHVIGVVVVRESWPRLDDEDQVDAHTEYAVTAWAQMQIRSRSRRTRGMQMTRLRGPGTLAGTVDAQLIAIATE
jgi:hypothetical protein